MKKTALLISFIMLILAACSPQPTATSLVTAPTTKPLSPPVSLPTNLPVPTSISLATNIPVASTPAEQAAIASLSSMLNLTADQIKVISTQAVI